MHKNFKVNNQAVLKNGSKVLLLKRNNKWTLPGGRFDEGDSSLEESLKREIKEETGIEDVAVGKIIHVSTSANLKTLLLFFVASTNTSKVVLSGEHEDSGWFGLNELKELDLEYAPLVEIILLG